MDGLREFEPFLCATQRSHEFTISADYRHSFSTMSDISQPRVDWIRRRAMLLHRWTLGSLPSSILDAVYAHDLSGLRTLLRDRQPARNRETLLGFQQAVGDNLADVVEVFLEEGIDLNGVEATGFTALISAVRGGQVPMVNRLLVAGADVNVPDAHGATKLAPIRTAATIRATLPWTLPIDVRYSYRLHYH